jgi:hypothetical protein
MARCTSTLERHHSREDRQLLSIDADDDSAGGSDCDALGGGIYLKCGGAWQPAEADRHSMDKVSMKNKTLQVRDIPQFHPSNGS